MTLNLFEAKDKEQAMHWWVIGRSLGRDELIPNTAETIDLGIFEQPYLAGYAVGTDDVKLKKMLQLITGKQYTFFEYDTHNINKTLDL